ncbi:protein of unknown function DUF1538 [Parvibaculum lavamentivorans DS-1]|uniref:DUF1538 domain-containing protein n=1 Tax=Parvibaculum lavamentivorans (strain DS-1 / DSM 13023 / NCIMB 13966) TaxID=402881 RepID=A7HYU5_PARL1|nr:DUF1538 domain-containing protein [Parvibaculum lavamentivorans]ABS65078.1 protein of unknown function DUF1538 [Parvibaculum lavamentivorans DS-1]
MYGRAILFLREIAGNLRDLLPVLGVVALFQFLVLGEEMPDLYRRFAGILLLLVGMTLFVRGLAMSIFPLGEDLADLVARRGSLLLLVGFGFAIGFGSTVAEPALGIVALQASSALADTRGPAPGDGAVGAFATVLRYVVACAVGAGVALAVLRLVKGWPIVWFILPGYTLATVFALASGSALGDIAFDAGAASTSAINIPLMLALGVGLATTIRGRNPVVDGFGFVAMASLAPMLVVLVFSLFAG